MADVSRTQRRKKYFNVKEAMTLLDLLDDKDKGSNSQTAITSNARCPTCPVYSPSQWYTIARMSRRAHPYVVQEMQKSDFLNFKLLASACIKNRSKDNTGAVVPWLKIKHLCYLTNLPDAVLFMTKMSTSEFKTLMTNTSRRKIVSIANDAVLKPLFACTQTPRISTAKYNDLQELCKSMCIPPDFHAFYAALPHDKSVRDALSEPNFDEDSD